ELTALAVTLALLVGIPAGIVSASRRDQAVDNVTRVGTLLGLSIPVFWQGTMLILFFSIYLRWMPPVVWVDFFTDPRRNLTIMLLPALCLGTASAANIARTTRASMLDVMRSEYIRTAAAKGLTDRLVILKHALRNALIPIVTVAGLQMGILLGGPVVVEEVLIVPGVGRGVDTLAAGDHVILSWAPTCGRCHYCVIGRPNLCERRLPGRGLLLDGTTRMSLSGRPVYQYGHVGTYASVSVVPESCAIAIDPTMPLELAALVGCSVMTGVG